MKASGTLGLDAFLPSPDRALPLAQEDLGFDNSEVPHLPLTPQWQDAHFSLLSVMGASRELNVRAWTLRLLQRYRFVIGKCLSGFRAVYSNVSLRLQRIPHSRSSCLKLSTTLTMHWSG